MNTHRAMAACSSLIICLLPLRLVHAGAAGAETRPVAPPGTAPLESNWLTPEQRLLSQRSVDRALAWLAAQQENDGSFPTFNTGQPGVTALCLLAFLSRGHVPDEGPCGTILHQGLDYVLRCQQPNGLIAPPFPYPPNPRKEYNPAHTAHYNHAIAGLLLSEAFGMTHGEQSRQIRLAIEKALAYTRHRQDDPKKYADDKGGWRYIRPMPADDSDLSVTSWHLMFLRSCRNAGFEVPSEQIDRALAYVQRCFDPKEGTFAYGLTHGERFSRGMAGAGILALSLGGQHQSREALAAGEWILRLPPTRFGSTYGLRDRFYYGSFYCSLAMLQLGTRYWERFYPRLFEELTAHQEPDGSWPPEMPREAVFGTPYSTALAVLTLTTPYQLLPIFQR